MNPLIIITIILDEICQAGERAGEIVIYSRVYSFQSRDLSSSVDVKFNVWIRVLIDEWRNCNWNENGCNGPSSSTDHFTLLIITWNPTIERTDRSINRMGSGGQGQHSSTCNCSSAFIVVIYPPSQTLKSHFYVIGTLFHIIIITAENCIEFPPNSLLLNWTLQQFRENNKSLRLFYSVVNI